MWLEPKVQLTKVQLTKVQPIRMAAFLGALLVGVLGVGEAAPATLPQFLGALETRPELAAASAAVEAAEAALAQAQNPVALDLDVSSRAVATQLTPFSDTRLGVGVRAYPFRYGQLGDVVRLREVDLERARLEERVVRAQLETSALESALALEFSQQAWQLARSSADAAEKSYQTAQLRFERGLATPTELRDADVGRQRTRNLVLNAEADAKLSRTTLASLVGDVQLKALPELTVPREPGVTPPTVRRAELALVAAQIGQAGAARPFYPVAEITYDYDVTAQNRLSASVSSDDLAPRVGYSFDYDGYGEAAQLSLRVSATLAPEQFENVTRLEALVRSAAASLSAAQQNAALSEAQLRTRLAAAQRDERLATLVFDNAERNLSEVRERETLGAGTPLETQAAAVTLAGAGIGVRDARRATAAALLDFYVFFGLPLSASSVGMSTVGISTAGTSTPPATPMETP